MTATALIVAAAVAGIAVSPDAGRVVQAQAGGQLGAGGEYHPVTPTRVLDTRERALDVRPFGKKSTNGTFNVPIVGKAGLPSAVDNVLAVAVNITVVQPTGKGWLRGFGKGASEGTTSIVNFAAGQTVPNNAILRPGRDGELTIRMSMPPGAGSAHVVIDVFGWFSTSTNPDRGARLIAPAAGPGRIYDSREAGGPRAAGSQTAIQIRGADAFEPAQKDIVPNSADVVGVMVNLTGVNNIGASQQTYLSALPEPLASGAEPSTSNLNLRPGDVRASTTILPVGTDGKIRIYNRAGQTHFVIDVVGYLVKGKPEDTKAGRVVPLVAPFRALDTRERQFGDQPLGAARAEDWSFESFANDVKVGTAAVGPQLGLIGNLTAVGLQRQYSWIPARSYLTAFPTPSSGKAVPTISNINLGEGAAVPNMAMLEYGARGGEPNQVRFYNRAGSVDYLLDVSAVILAD